MGYLTPANLKVTLTSLSHGICQTFPTPASETNFASGTFL